MKKIVFTLIIFCFFYHPSLSKADDSCVTQSFGENGDLKKVAKIVYFYMGDSYLTTLAQETVNLSEAFEGGDYNVLILDENETDQTKFLKAKALDMADEVLAPTKDNFLNSVKNLADEGYVIDIYIFSHGYQYYSKSGKDIAYFVSQDGKIKNTDIAALKPEGCGQFPIRMVHSIACYISHMNEAWVTLGAKAVSGAQYINFYPTQYGRFARQWNKGKTFEKSLDLANTAASRGLVQTYISALAFKLSNKGSCGYIPNVMGKTQCAESYFTGAGDYNLDSDYDPYLSGKENMNESSKKIIDGDGSITKNTVLYWEIQ